MNNINLMQGDCLELIKNIPDGSVDLVLTDPPYGTMKNAALDGWNNKTTEWDNEIDPTVLFNELTRILRQNGKVVLFSQEPYTSRLIISAIPSLPFSYRAMWYKNVHANALIAKTAMVNRFEDICIFTKPCPKHDFCGENPLREYFAKVYDFIGKTKKEMMQIIGQKADHCFRLNSSQYSLCTKSTYKELIDVFGIDKMDGFCEWEKLKPIQEQYQEKNRRNIAGKYPPIFNLWEGGKSKANVLEYKKDNDGYHPTQKPVALLEDLIQTYSNEGNTVLDFTMGSGSTGVACVNTNRRFIGIELDEGFFNIAKKRIEEAQKEVK